MDPEIDFESELADLDFEAELSSLEQPQPKATSATPGIVAVAGAAKAAPAVVAGVNTVAKGVSAIDPTLAAILGSAAPIPGGSAIGAAAPKVAGVIAKATAPAKAIDTGSQFVKAMSKAGPAMRGANWISRAAGKASLPLTLLSLLLDAQNQTEALAADQSIDPAEKNLIRQRIARPFEQ